MNARFLILAVFFLTMNVGGMLAIATILTGSLGLGMAAQVAWLVLVVWLDRR